jgi:hypothetical protein
MCSRRAFLRCVALRRIYSCCCCCRLHSLQLYNTCVSAALCGSGRGVKCVVYFRQLVHLVDRSKILFHCWSQPKLLPTVTTLFPCTNKTNVPYALALRVGSGGSDRTTDHDRFCAQHCWRGYSWTEDRTPLGWRTRRTP